MNDRSPGYEPDGISWLPYLAMNIASKVYYITIMQTNNEDAQ